MPVYLTAQNISPLIKTREKFSHKGTYGHALLIAGSYGKVGAAVLSSKGCLRSGVGLLTVHIPSCGLEIIQISVPEAMCEVDKNNKFVTDLSNDLSVYSAIGIGPGLGTSKESVKALEQVLHTGLPGVIDADALNLLSQSRFLLEQLHGNIVLTPHPKEFERLAGKSETIEERLQLQLEFSSKHKCTVVVKDAETTITASNGEVFVNTTGNPGMATGGAGDVLTGIVLGLLAQGYSPENAAKIAVYHHGLSGDEAAKEKGCNALIAGDLVNFLRIETEED